MKNIIVIFFIFSASFGAFTQEVYKIYEGTAPGSENWTDPETTVAAPWSGNPLIYNVTEPTITIYRPNRAVNTGAAMIIAPGGGNRFLTWKEEGTNVAEWFQRHGITGILLKYRTIQAGTKEEIETALNATWPPAPQQNTNVSEDENTSPQSTTPPREETTPTLQGDDGRKAIEYVRKHADELGVNPDKIGLMGFSAGAMLTSNAIFINNEISRPDFAAFIYGGGLTNDIPNRMPLFICSPVNDLFPADDLFQTYKNWKEAGEPAELHFIYGASHGAGLQYNAAGWNEWIENLYNFMQAVEFIE